MAKIFKLVKYMYYNLFDEIVHLVTSGCRFCQGHEVHINFIALSKIFETCIRFDKCQAQDLVAL